MQAFRGRDVAANTSPLRAPSRTAAPKIRASVLPVQHSMTSTVAFVRNGRLDLLAINQFGRALYALVFDEPARSATLHRARCGRLSPAVRRT